jgi:ferredoxin
MVRPSLSLGAAPAMPTVRVNPIQCAAHGLCAELLPERITLDEWGYPILDGSVLPAEMVKNARRAANACPTLALILEPDR